MSANIQNLVSDIFSFSKQSVLYAPGNNDECYEVHAYAVKAILQYIPPGKIVWCPFNDESSQFGKVLAEAGIKVIHSHQDFLQYEPPEHWDILIGNPTFKGKRITFERAISFNKPFALIMANTWLNDAAPKQIFGRGHSKLQLLMFKERMKFLNHDSKITFSSSYFCQDFLPQPIVFDSLKNYGY